MDFFKAQDDARRKSLWLILMMGAAVLALVLIAFLMMAGLLWYSQQATHLTYPFTFYLTPKLFFGCLVSIGGIVLLGSLIKLFRLSKGAGALMQSMGGRSVAETPATLREQVLRNLVEETAIASGTPVPDVYILDDEPAINAFAVGLSLDDAALGFTRGCVERLDRDELEGVVAHEFSHLVHGDSRLNLRLMGVLYGITMISSLGMNVLRGQRYSSNSKGSGAVSLVGIGLLVIGYSGVFFASLIRSGVSRQREFLADASAVQYTRNTRGLAGALKRIGGYPSGSELATPMAADVGHMMFSRAVSSWVGGLFATHPPLPQRILRLEPQWRGDFLEGVGEVSAFDTRSVSAAVPSAVSGLADIDSISAERISLEQVGNAGQAERSSARNLLQGIEPELQLHAHQPNGALAIVSGLLLSTDGEVRQKQLSVLKNQWSEPRFSRICSLAKPLDALPSLQRLTLLNLCLPILKRQPSDLRSQLIHCVQQLVAADGKLSHFEWALQALVQHQLRVKSLPKGAKQLQPQLRNLRLLFSWLAFAGRLPVKESAASCSLAYRIVGVKDAGLIPPERLKPAAVTSALFALVALQPQAKKRFLEACKGIVVADNRVLVTELQVLRTIAEVLGCPLPMLAAIGKNDS
ncbi:M48 family metallopeptidase [Aestuariirhabdus sp. Z084]|uniref:M48 family metallopeptidase n=1 Tax=Aestuariirhabdus haliotis TaxID=2918751 RepID=UPI00201B358E|nr:M48 family metallopeptidase [Aestuariirhabdus haliotis]MCL6416773.1 M48 family metallopeptidase [Aestuariirhabdus haliotis]MCL6420762.1 M48 family metallopeptidase [Aestuariirhabdus haliotis]